MVKKTYRKNYHHLVKKPYGCPEGKRVWGFYLEIIHACPTKENEKMY